MTLYGWLVLATVFAACICRLVSSQLKWYYTGQVRNNLIGDSSRNLAFQASGGDFSGKDLSHPESDYILYYGGIILKRWGNESAIPRSDYPVVESILRDELLGYKHRIGSRIAEIVGLTSYSMLISPSYASFPVHQTNVSSSDLTDVVYQAEIGQYNPSTKQFLDRRWSDMSVGDLHVVTLAVSDRPRIDNSTTFLVGSIGLEGTMSVDASTGDLHTDHADDRPALTRENHKVIFTSDHRGHHSLYSHTWLSDHLNDSHSSRAHHGPPKLRIMSFNLWHNNPPHWVYPDRVVRWARYNARMKHFADIIAHEDPDIIAIQEVRLDAGFVAIDGRLLHWNDAALSKHDGGNQVEHILTHLAQARARINNSNADIERALNRTGDYYYHVLFQPAMSMIDLQKPSQRNEEGLLILSKADLPIVDFEVQLLPRDTTDPSDDHQRAVLKADIRVPARYVRREGDRVCASPSDYKDAVLQVLTSHFSLSDKARDLAVQHVVRTQSPSADIQVLLGDLNAEPHEDAIQYLLHGSPNHSPFVDAWTHVHNRSDNSARTQPDDEANGFTFPTCNPVKRIDYILVRNHSCREAAMWPLGGSTVARIADFRIVGKRPTAETGHLVNSRVGLGMNDLDSPIWASDHLAVVADIELVQA